MSQGILSYLVLTLGDFVLGDIIIGDFVLWDFVQKCFCPRGLCPKGFCHGGFGPKPVFTISELWWPLKKTKTSSSIACWSSLTSFLIFNLSKEQFSFLLANSQNRAHLCFQNMHSMNLTSLYLLPINISVLIVNM